MHFTRVTLPSGKIRYSGITWSSGTWVECSHLHRYPDIAWTCSRRFGDRLRKLKAAASTPERGHHD